MVPLRIGSMQKAAEASPPSGLIKTSTSDPRSGSVAGKSDLPAGRKGGSLSEGDFKPEFIRAAPEAAR